MLMDITTESEVLNEQSKKSQQSNNNLVLERDERKLAFKNSLVYKRACKNNIAKVLGVLSVSSAVALSTFAYKLAKDSKPIEGMAATALAGSIIGCDGLWTGLVIYDSKKKKQRIIKLEDALIDSITEKGDSDCEIKSYEALEDLEAEYSEADITPERLKYSESITTEKIKLQVLYEIRARLEQYKISKNNNIWHDINTEIKVTDDNVKRYLSYQKNQ